MSRSVTLVCGTNRREAVTLTVTMKYQQILESLGVETKLINLADLPQDFIFTALYENYGKNEKFNPFVELMLKSTKYVFVVPEYNGSFPGALKTFIDGLEYPNTFRNKKAALVGIASSGMGASLALSHLTDIFNFCGTNILAYKVRLEKIESVLKDNQLTDPGYIARLEKQAKMLLEF